MTWINLTSETQLAELITRSSSRPQLIFKHSTRCNISSMALNRLQGSQPPEGIDFYLLDLVAHRSLSHKIAQDFHVHHESPQALLIRNGECVYEESHYGIEMGDIVEQAGVF